MNDICPECSNKISRAEAVAQLPVPLFNAPFIILSVQFCTECDWSMVQDWKRLSVDEFKDKSIIM